MYLLYVDESGDVGRKNGSSDFFVLSGLVCHELSWNAMIDEVIQFRRRLREVYGLKLREEIHAAAFIHKPKKLARIRKDMRLRILRDTLDFMESLRDVNVNIIHVLVCKNDKPQNYDVFIKSWEALIQRFDNTLSHGNFPGPQNPKDHGVIIADKTDEPKLRSLTRRLRRYNPVPHIGGGGYRDMPLKLIVEDAIHRDSLHSFVIQLVDVSAYFLYQKNAPCKYIRKKGARNYFNRLDNVLCKVASRNDAKGVVHL